MADEYAVLQMSDYICWEMLQAAVDKVYEYHCRVPMYIKTDSPAQQEEDEDFDDEDFDDDDFDEDASFEE